MHVAGTAADSRWLSPPQQHHINYRQRSNLRHPRSSFLCICHGELRSGVDLYGTEEDMSPNIWTTEHHQELNVS